MSSNGKFPDDWYSYLKDDFQKESFKQLRKFVSQERITYKIFPEQEDIFRAFIETPFEKLKVVILGQDPYHGRNQAHGLAFSVQDNTPIPPSLRNIFQELHSDLNIETPQNGNLIEWARRGVFLLNTVLTVREKEAHSHKNRGWEEFTDSVIEKISTEKSGVVFILWGRPAGEKRKLIDESKHFVITSPHPSPLSALRGFFGSRPFSKTNSYLKSVGAVPINWKLS
jgi:uracil-DNA glycosylase